MSSLPISHQTGRGKECPQCGFDHEVIRDRCRRSLFATATILCGFKDLSKNLHGKLCSWIETNIRSGNRRMLILLPRGHLKSSIATIAGSIWFTINNPNVRILLVQASAKKALETIDVISSKLLGDEFVHFFPEIIPDKRRRWNRTEIEVARSEAFAEATISARGVTSKIVGGHYDVIIMDDVIDETIVSSDLEMEGVISWFQVSEPLFVLPSVGVQIVIGTRWRTDDLYAHIKDVGEHTVLESGVHVDDRSKDYGFGNVGEPIWPERFPEEEIARIRKRMGSEWHFLCQYENAPVSDDVKRFRQSDIQYFNWIEPGRVIAINDAERIEVANLDRTMCVDPAIGEKRSSDESAITVCGIDSRGRIFVLDEWHGRVNPSSLIDKIFELQDKWKPRVIGIESVSFQRALLHFFRQEQHRRGKFFPVDELSTGHKSKAARIEGLSPYFNNKQVWLQRSHQKLERQLLNWPDTISAHDDIIDSLAYHTKYWFVSDNETATEDDVLSEEEYDVVVPYGLRIPA